MTDALAVAFTLVGIALVAIGLRFLEAQYLNLGILLGLGQQDPRVSTWIAGAAICVFGILISLAGRVSANRGKLQ